MRRSYLLNAEPRCAKGDIIKLQDKSQLIIEVKKGNEIITMTGPVVFKFSKEKLDYNIKRGKILYNLYLYLSNNIEPYYPTTVSAVRRVKTGQGEDVDKIKRGMAEYSSGEYEKALTTFNEIVKDEKSSNSTRENINYFIADIYFKKMEYEKALALFEELIGNSVFLRQDYLENCYVNCMMCGEYLGNDDVKDLYAALYFEKYGKTGKYSEMVEKEILDIQQ